MGNQLLEFVKGFVDSGYCRRWQQSLGLATTSDDNDINRKACALLAVEVTPNGKVLNDAIVFVKEVEKGSTFTGIVAA